MIIFEKITYRNFLSFGDTDTEVQLNSCGKTLIIGKNGHGKSTLLDALSFVLFGKPYRNIKKSQLMNSINMKNCLVTISFTIGNQHYEVRRGMKPNIFEIYQNGKIMDQSARALDHQKILEEQILKLNHKSFNQICVLGSANFVPFMQLPAAQRREIIEDLLDIKIFSIMKILSKDKLKGIKETLTDIQKNIDNCNNQIKLQNGHISNVEKIINENETELKAELTATRKTISLLDADKRDLISKMTDIKTVEDRLSKKKKSLTQLITIGAKIESNIHKHKSQAAFFQDNECCPTCDQTVAEDHRDNKIQEAQSKSSELEQGYSDLKNKTKEIQNVISDLDKEIIDERKHLQKIQTIEHSLKIQKDIEQKTTNKILKASGDHNLDMAKSQLNQMYDEKNVFINEKDIETTELRYYSAIQEILKDTGIKTQIIRQYVPIMNKLINDYLKILDFFVLFTLDENFNETIRSRHRDEFSYTSFSEGEKSRIDLAILFTWREIARLKNSANTNLLILDETLDQSLDADGIDKLMSIIQQTSKQSNIFVISHREVNKASFDSVIEAVKPNNFSMLKKDAN